MHYTRRDFLTTAASAAGAAMLPLGSALAAASGGPGPAKAARWHRYDVTSPQGQKMLASYARGVEAMIKLPPSDPRNWFRNAFVHFLDCPHGNWWFYVWHRGYIGYFERTIRELSGDPEFALPYWDWTRLPEIPAGMFDGVLTPTDASYATYTGNLKRFTDFIQRPMQDYWGKLADAQRTQLLARGYKVFGDVWNDVTGYSVAQKTGISGNMSYAITCGARYLSRDNPKLDPKTAHNVSAGVVASGLEPLLFHSEQISRSFTSSRTASHLMQPDGATQFSILEGLPHNKVHNYIGGVGAVDPGPYGNMTNFLSPVDPIFFLHHANMDRLWDVWTRKQLALGLPIQPDAGEARDAFMNEPFLFFVEADGTPVGPSKAQQYFDTASFDYDYGPGGFAGPQPKRRAPSNKYGAVSARIDDDIAELALPAALVQAHMADALPAPLVAEITLDRPEGVGGAREFDVLVNAPEGVDRVDADSPYYGGTVAFFGSSMPNMTMTHTATFAVPLGKRLRVFSNAASAGAKAGAELKIRLVTSGAQAPEATPVRAAVVAPGS